MQATVPLETQAARLSATSYATLVRRILLFSVVVFGAALGRYWSTLVNQYLYVGAVTCLSALVCCWVAHRSTHARRAWYLLGAAQAVHVGAYVAAVYAQGGAWSYAWSAWTGNISIAVCWCGYLFLVTRSRTQPGRVYRAIKLAQIVIACLTLVASLGSGILAGDGDTRVWVEIATVALLTVLAWITLQLRLRAQHLARCVFLYLGISLLSLLVINVLWQRFDMPDMIGVPLLPLAEVLLCEWALGGSSAGRLTQPLQMDMPLLKTLQHGVLTTACVILIVFCLKHHLVAAVTCTSLMLVLAFVRIHLDYAPLHQERIHLRERAEHLHRLATRDALTGLSNRLWFEQQGNALLNQKEWSSIVLLLIDTDHFKQLNDTQGHRAGDQGLCMVADVLARVCDAQLVARIGGDEFAILCTDYGHAEAERVAEQIRSRVEEVSLARKLGITVSIGGAFTRDPNILSDMLHAADMALYVVKNKGRNGTHLVQLEKSKSNATSAMPAAIGASALHSSPR